MNLESIKELISEYQAAFEAADELLKIVDDEETPYKSKYQARHVKLLLTLSSFSAVIIKLIFLRII